MNKFFYLLGDLYETVFTVMKSIGPVMNVLIMLSLATAFCYWLGQMTKHKEPKF